MGASEVVPEVSGEYELPQDRATVWKALNEIRKS